MRRALSGGAPRQEASRASCLRLQLLRRNDMCVEIYMLLNLGEKIEVHILATAVDEWIRPRRSTLTACWMDTCEREAQNSHFVACKHASYNRE